MVLLVNLRHLNLGMRTIYGVFHPTITPIEENINLCRHFSAYCARYENRPKASRKVKCDILLSLHINQYHVLSKMKSKNELFPNNSSTKIGNIQRNFSLDWLSRLAVAQSEWFQSMSSSSVVIETMSGIQLIHDTTLLSWWATIVITTVVLRSAIMLPLSIYQGYIFAKVENVEIEIRKLLPQLKKETEYAVHKYNWDKNHAKYMFIRSVKKIRRELIIEQNCHPFKTSVLLWFQLPIWVSVSLSLRNLTTMMPLQDTNAQIVFMEMSTGGFLWIPNLTVPDASLILPVAMAVFNLMNIEITAMNRAGTGSRLQTIFTNVFRGIALMFIPLASCVPSGMALYWTTSSLYGLIQNIVLLNPSLRRKCGIPPSPSQRLNPYEHLWNSLQQKYTFKRFEK